MDRQIEEKQTVEMVDQNEGLVEECGRSGENDISHGADKLTAGPTDEQKLTKKQRQRRNKQLREQKAKINREQEERAKQELRNLLKAKIGEQRIQRASKQNKEKILDQTLRKIGIDKEKFKQDLEAVKKQGGMEISMKQ